MLHTTYLEMNHNITSPGRKKKILHSNFLQILIAWYIFALKSEQFQDLAKLMDTGGAFLASGVDCESWTGVDFTVVSATFHL